MIIQQPPNRPKYETATDIRDDLLSFGVRFCAIWKFDFMQNIEKDLVKAGKLTIMHCTTTQCFAIDSLVGINS